jgi:hypothetical protein
VEDLYNENYKILMREIENTKTGKTSHVHGLEEFSIIKMSILLKGINAISIKIPMKFYIELEKAIVIFIRKPKGP